MKRQTLILILFVLAKLALQYLVIHPDYDLHRDEYLHLDQGQHLAWGYHSVPPFTSWISWIIYQLGNSHVLVKFFPALFGALTMVVVWKTIAHLKGSLYACALAATALLCSSLLRVNILYQPNSFDILAWTLIFYTLIRFIQTQKERWLYLLALSFALGFLNKYNIAFCMLGLLPALVVSPYRYLFTRKVFYLSALLGLVIISPNLIWQYQHQFPVLQHMKELSETQLVHVNRLDFLSEQIFFFIGSAFILVAALVGLLIYAPFKPYRLLFFSFVSTLAIFTFFKAKAYYALGLYPILFAFGSVYLSELLKRGWVFYLRYAAIAIILFFFYVLLILALPIFPPQKYVRDAEQKLAFSEHTWEDGKKHPISQDFADMLGWRELAAKVDSLYLTLADKKGVFILCDNYGQTGAINYYSKQGLKAHSFTNDYINWMDLSIPIHTIIRIKEAEEPDLSRELTLFSEAKAVTQIDHPHAREKGTQIVLLTMPIKDVQESLAAARKQMLGR